MNAIEDSIIYEKEERIWETEEAVNQVWNSLDTVQEEFDSERYSWIEWEKEIKQTLDDNVYQLSKTIDKEKTQRNLEVGSFKDKTADTLKAY